VLVASLPWAPAPAAARSADTAALQVALRAEGLYAGAIDGLRGPATRRAVRRFQRRERLAIDGIVGPRTRRALGRRGRPRLGRRVMQLGAEGWDVAALQFLLGTRGFATGGIDGGFGPRTDGALRRFQRWAGLWADGLAGPATVRALRRGPPRSPLGLRLPVGAPVSSPFGPRGGRMHTGIDFAAPFGAPVAAARGGTVTWAGWRDGGWGYLVSIAHGGGVRTLYAHLSSVEVLRGARVGAGRRLGRVGATGVSQGPHLHFELRLRGAAVDPWPALR
jgi:murein DD-endopeptidase MepM/ murein hydrolase activator NlpD